MLKTGRLVIFIAFGISLDRRVTVLNVRIAGRDETFRVILFSPLSKFHLLGGTNMTRVRNIITAGALVLSFVTISYGGTITGSRTGATGSRTGTITGSRTGTITGSRVGTITGSRVGTITGSGAESPRSVLENIQTEYLFRLMRLIVNGGW